MPIDLKASRIAAAQGKFEPQRQNNFWLDIDVPGALGADMSIIALCMRSFPFPSSNTELIKIPFVNSERKAPGRTTYDDYALVVHDYVDQAVAEVIHKWRELIFNPVTGIVSLCKDIKAQGLITLYAPDGTHTRTWKLIGMWPSKASFGKGDMNTGEVNQIEVTFSVDYFIAGNLKAS
jgi:hypothetical protein